MFRRIFTSRIYPPHIIKKLGVKHVKGMILYGPPGCGKTLIATKIAECIKAKPPKLVPGPSIFDKYVGGSEKNIRDLFADAEREKEEKGDESDLHIIIIDEIDAICAKRGSHSDSTGVHDSVVNQLLAKIDGLNSLNNILLIGMTNRLDMLDEAIIRPGRFEIHIQIELPDLKGREQIYRIHTKSMKENNMLDSDVDIEYLAKRSEN